MKQDANLVVGINAFRLINLIEKAASYKNLTPAPGCEYSEPIKEYFLDAELLDALDKRGIHRQSRHDCNDEIFTLVDENPQEKIPGWSTSNYWNFQLRDGKFDLRVHLVANFSVSVKMRGIIFTPFVHGTFLSPTSKISNFRMFKALVENDANSPAVAKELAAGDGDIVVSWTDLGLGGIRNIIELFKEFAGGNKKVTHLADIGVFTPDPHSSVKQGRYHDGLFVIEPVQPKIFQAWQEQLDNYRNELVL